MELKDLAGLHKLSGVDFENIKVNKYGSFEDANTIRFCLDGKIYTAIEDPCDDYRSCMKEIILSKATMTNKFKPMEVVGIYRDKSGYNSCDILELVNISNGRTVVRVGTDNNDDYYPFFVSEFNPENI